ncbi:MAG TPA: UDP-N-acetylmuramoyl-L-alanyl-D-glutamate--2,6-diaminopimelate ligase [Acidimicrobiales bacterium]|nr:UDP-N-acetylmuramoyl-L-alanyl-D-glutamate--2,6-diaminopimelate ligase [Acidimicrobiales bacterium]
MRLDRLLGQVDVVETRGDPARVDVRDIVFNTAEVVPGALYCCLPGDRFDGHDFAPEAVAAGAPALLCERLLPLDVVQVCVGAGQARAAMAQVAAAFHGHPADSLRVVGVTGTNGKTTVTHLLKAVCEANGWPTAVVGTLDGGLTTPDAPSVQRSLASYRDAGQVAVAMEVSSHALIQRRVDAIRFVVAVFTNLSQDHLDYHRTMDAYFSAKSLLFTPARTDTGVVNADDPWGRRLLESAPIGLRSFSLADADELEVGAVGSTFRWEGRPVTLNLSGRFNVANALAAATAARQMGIDPGVVAEGLSAVRGVPGRFEMVEAGQSFKAVVDYAHTPSALEQALTAARHAAQPEGRVLVVFGCGGDRDRHKRPDMGRIATTLADLAVLTSDNPRSEDPMAIIAEVRGGVDRRDRLVVEPDRAAAIALAVSSARPGDVVVVAGKGHETGQRIGERTIDFDDRVVTRSAIEDTAGARR